MPASFSRPSSALSTLPTASATASAIVLSPWGKAAAGALAALIANTLVYPLDLAKTRLQVQTKSGSGEYYKDTWDVISKVYKKGGLSALYSGIGGTLTGVVSTNFAYFYWYSLVRGQYLKRNNGKQLTTAVELLLGAVAGALAQLFTIPVSVVTTRQQTSEGTESTGFFQAGRDVVAQDGVSGLWRGLKASLILVVNPSITYGTSSRVRALLFGERPVLSVYENFCLGAVSKSLATIATQPLIVAKVMQQSSRRKAKQENGELSDEKASDEKSSRPHFDSFVDALVYMYKTEGLLGLFKGIGPQLGKGILVQGLLLAFKDEVEFYLILLLRALRKRTSLAPVVQI